MGHGEGEGKLSLEVFFSSVGDRYSETKKMNVLSVGFFLLFICGFFVSCEAVSDSPSVSEHFEKEPVVDS